jgi:DNA-directed RNA polymerase specialized sigma24 family protein
MLEASSAKTDGHQSQALSSPTLDLIEALYDRAGFLERTAEDVWELVKETLIRALDGYHRIDPEVTTRRWLLRIMHAVFLHKKRQREGGTRSVCVDLLHPRRTSVTTVAREHLPTDEIEGLLRSMLVHCSATASEA